MVAASTKKLSVDEYLAMEAASEERHDYVRGDVYAMTGASRIHGLIVANISRSIGNHLVARPCELFIADTRVRIEASDIFTYPDIVVVCAGAKWTAKGGDTLLNPQLIVEVLSPSTEAYDRGLKWAAYQTIPSLMEFVLVSQDRRLVERYRRQDDGQWLFAAQREGALELKSIDVMLPLDEIYLKVPPAPDA